MLNNSRAVQFAARKKKVIL